MIPLTFNVTLKSMPIWEGIPQLKGQSKRAKPINVPIISFGSKQD